MLKHRRRRERAERRLAATQENLERLGDLVREVRRQIRPLERQAAAARSHAALAEELRDRAPATWPGSELAALGDATPGRGGRAGRAGGGGDRAAAGRRRRARRAAAAAAAELSSRREEDLAVRPRPGPGPGRADPGDGRRAAGAVAGRWPPPSTRRPTSTSCRRSRRRGPGWPTSWPRPTDRGDGARSRSRASTGPSRALADDERPTPRRGGTAPTSGRGRGALTAARGRIEMLRRRAIDQDRRNLAALDRRIVDGRGADRRRSTGRPSDLATTATELGGRGRPARRRGRGGRRRGQPTRSRRAETAERTAAVAEQQRHRTAARAEALARALEELEGAGGRRAAGRRRRGRRHAGRPGRDRCRAGRRRSRPRPARRWRPSSSTAGRPFARRWRRLREQGATGAVLAARAATGAAPSRRRTVPRSAARPGAEPVRPHVRRAGRAGAPGAVARGSEAVLDVARRPGRPGRRLGAGRRPGARPSGPGRRDRPTGDRFADAGWRVRSATGVVTAAAVEEASAGPRRRRCRPTGPPASWPSARRALEAARVAARHRGPGRRPARGRPGGRRRPTGRVRPRSGTGSPPSWRTPRRARDEAATQVEADRAALAELEAGLPALEATAAEATDAGGGGRGGVGGAAGPPGRAAPADPGARGAARPALDERRRVLTQRQAEVERRLEGHAEEREAAAARRQRLEADGVALERLGRLVGRGAREARRGVLEALRTDYRHQVEAVRAGRGAARVAPPRPGRGRAAGWSRCASGPGRSTWRPPRSALRTEAADRAGPPRAGQRPGRRGRRAARPSCPTDVTAADHADDAGRQAGDARPGQPAGPRGAVGARGAAPGAGDPDRRRPVGPARAAGGHPRRSTTRSCSRSPRPRPTSTSTSRRSSPCCSPAGPAGSSLTEPDDLLHTGVEIEVRPAGRNVRRVSLLSGRRALAGRAGVPLRRLPQPAVALLPDGRGRGGARRRQPAPVPRPGPRVPRRGAADHRQPPEADDGDRRRPLRRDDGPGWVVTGGEPEGGQGAGGEPRRDRPVDRPRRSSPARCGRRRGRRTSSGVSHRRGPGARAADPDPPGAHRRRPARRDRRTAAAPDAARAAPAGGSGARGRRGAAPRPRPRPRSPGRRRASGSGWARPGPLLRLRAVRGRATVDAATWDELEEALLRADVGVATTQALLADLRRRVQAKEVAGGDGLLGALRADLRRPARGRAAVGRGHRRRAGGRRPPDRRTAGAAGRRRDRRPGRP